MVVVCAKNAENKSLVYSETEAALQPSTGRCNLQGQETRSFEQAHVGVVPLLLGITCHNCGKQD